MDDWRINPDDPVPIGEQIVFRILYAIARGVYKPGDKLPTVREIATRLRVNNVRSIPRGPNGKFRAVISRVPQRSV